MRAYGRQAVALVGLFGTMAFSLCAPAAGFGDTLKAEAEISTKDISTKESILGDAIADAIKASAKSDIAFIAADYFNEVTIAKGNVDKAAILKALESPGDTIVIVKLTGDQITRAMERSLLLHPKSNSAFLHFSGMTVTFKPDAEADKRVVSIKVAGDALETGKTYKVAMPSPLAKGSLSYFKIWKMSDIDKDTEKTLEAAANSYFSDHKTLAKGDERLVSKK